MPIKKAATKFIKTSGRRKKRNDLIKSRVKKTIKEVKKALDSKEKENISTLFQKAQKAIDKAIQGKVLKKNTGNRKKQRLSKLIKKVQKA